jgi:hypothetical protein
MSAETVTYQLHDNMAWLGLNRPQKGNAIDSRLLAALHESASRGTGESFSRRDIVYQRPPAPFSRRPRARLSTH